MNTPTTRSTCSDYRFASPIYSTAGSNILCCVGRTPGTPGTDWQAAAEPLSERFESSTLCIGEIALTSCELKHLHIILTTRCARCWPCSNSPRVNIKVAYRGKQSTWGEHYSDLTSGFNGPSTTAVAADNAAGSTSSPHAPVGPNPVRSSYRTHSDIRFSQARHA